MDDGIDNHGTMMVQTIDGMWLPRADCTYDDTLDCWVENAEDDDYPSWFKDYVDNKYGEEDEVASGQQQYPTVSGNGSGTSYGGSQQGGSGHNYSGGQSGNYQSSYSCPHEGVVFDLAFVLGGLSFHGSKAATVKSSPDFILDFSDSSWIASDQAFLKDVKIGPETPDSVKADLKKLEEYASHPIAIMTFKWADQGIPNCKMEFWTGLVDTMRALLKEQRNKTKGDIVFCCQGGHGRTGTALAAILITCGGFRAADAVDAIRSDYCDSAVESQKQIDYLVALDKQVAALFTGPEREKLRASVKRPNLNAYTNRTVEKAAAKAKKDADDAEAKAQADSKSATALTTPTSSTPAAPVSGQSGVISAGNPPVQSGGSSGSSGGGTALQPSTKPATSNAVGEASKAASDAWKNSSPSAAKGGETGQEPDPFQSGWYE